MTYTTQSYQGPPDLADMLALVRARPRELMLRFPSPADLYELVNAHSTPELTRLWRAPVGKLVGFALFNSGDTYASLVMEYPPQELQSGLGDSMIAWGEAVFQSSYHGQATSLSASAEEKDPARIELLERHGFIRLDEETVSMERALGEDIPLPELPAGFTIRPLLGEAEIPTWVALHRAAFGTENMTEDYRQVMAQSPGYNPDLDLVAVAPDGRLAAYVFGSISAEENALTGRMIGYTDPVGTHPDFQRLGLCRALLLACLHRLKERGMDTARLGTGSWNTAMQRAAQSAGFQVCGRTRLYEKEMVGTGDNQPAN